jgi:hypothetical protein
VGDSIERCDWVEPILVDAPESVVIRNTIVAPEPPIKRPPIFDTVERSLFDPAIESD